jgi:hypothetical protein
MLTVITAILITIKCKYKHANYLATSTTDNQQLQPAPLQFAPCRHRVTSRELEQGVSFTLAPLCVPKACRRESRQGNRRR